VLALAVLCGERRGSVRVVECVSHRRPLCLGAPVGPPVRVRRLRLEALLHLADAGLEGLELRGLRVELLLPVVLQQ